MVTLLGSMQGTDSYSGCKQRGKGGADASNGTADQAL